MCLNLFNIILIIGQIYKLWIINVECWIIEYLKWIIKNNIEKITKYQNKKDHKDYEIWNTDTE